MNKLSFFKSTPLYNGYRLLTIISDNPQVTQREIASKISVSVSMINSYLGDFERRGFIKRIYSSHKNVSYCITDIGEAQKKLMNIEYLVSALEIYNDAKQDCVEFLMQIASKGFKNILFYGAGEVAEIMLTVINNDDNLGINVLAIIDDDEMKQNMFLAKKRIISINEINDYEYDGILISSYTNNKDIYQKLIDAKLDKKNIIQFFE